MMSKIFFTSDTHFYHANILKFCSGTRKYNNIEEHNESLIAIWNERVKPNDVVYHLGDVAFANVNNTLNILNRLQGNINLIIGNHDKKLVKNAEFRKKFSSISHYQELKINGYNVVLFHFPIESWDRKHHGSIHLHGHTHSDEHHNYNNQIENRMDVGVDANPFNAPFTFEEVINTINTNG